MHVALAPGALLLGRYRVLHRLGCGGQGAVFAARDEQRARDVAIKAPRIDRRAWRVEREADSLRSVSHPNVISLVEFEPDHRPPLLIMDRAGPTLSDVIRRSPQRRVDAKTLAAVGRATLAAIEACHRVGLVHRDIKPSNIALDPARPEAARLIDLGLAHRPNDGAGSNRFAGTARYASIQTLEGTPHRPIDDAWGWLYTMIHAVAGGLPWSRTATHDQIVSAKRRYLGAMLCAGLPQPLDDARRELMATPDAYPPYDALLRITESIEASNGDVWPLAWDPRAWEATELRATFDAATAWRGGTSRRGSGHGG